MAHTQQQDFCKAIRKRHPNRFENVRVLDIGSLDINGNNRFLFTNPDYTGIDLGEGPNVDEVCKGHEHCSSIPYDVSISTECLEHDEWWKLTLANMWELTRPGGLILFTCASKNRAEHGTKRTSPANAPFVQDYYGNLTEQDIRSVWDIEALFDEWEFQSARGDQDLYFYGIKKWE